MAKYRALPTICLSIFPTFGLGFLPDADGFAHYAETRFGTLCHHYAGGFCALYAGIMPKISKRHA